MRFSVMLAVVALAGCAGKATKEAPTTPTADRQVPVDSSNIVEAQKAGYKIVNENGKTLYCKKDLNTGSHVRYTTTCLTEQEWQEMRDASHRSVEAMSRTRPPIQGK
jgi:hypothetical protein